jgi:hypothetical protein
VDDPAFFVRQWGSTGGGNGQFDDATGVAGGSGGQIYVADSFNARIQEFDPTGAFVRQWGSTGGSENNRAPHWRVLFHAGMTIPSHSWRGADGCATLLARRSRRTR